MNPQAVSGLTPRWLPLLLALWFTGCATAPSPPSPAKAPAVNLAGFPPEFRAGYGDGCASASVDAAARRRDEPRYKTDPQYAQGWRDGYDICRRRK